MTLEAIDPKTSNGALGELFTQIDAHLGMVPNFLRVLGHSPQMLRQYLAMDQALETGALSLRLRVCIGLAVSEINQSRYCIAAYSALGRIAGLSEEQISDCRLGTSPDRRIDAVLVFVRRLVHGQGHVPRESLARLVRTGYSDLQITEIVATAVITIWSNYLNLLAGTKIDFPKTIEPGRPAPVTRTDPDRAAAVDRT